MHGGYPIKYVYGIAVLCFSVVSWANLNDDCDSTCEVSLKLTSIKPQQNATMHQLDI